MHKASEPLWHTQCSEVFQEAGKKKASLPGLSCSRTELCTNPGAAHWPLLPSSVNRKPGLVCKYGLHCHLCEPMNASGFEWCQTGAKSIMNADAGNRDGSSWA